MSAVLTRRRTKGRGRDREGYRQSSLFGQVVAPAPLPSREEPPPAAQAPEAAGFDVPTTDVAPDADGHAPGAGAAVLVKPTLDEAISGLWTGLVSGEPGDCPLCGAAMQPRHSAGSGVVGGRCTGCSATLA